VGQGPFIIEASRSHPVIYTTLGRTHWTGDQPDAETSPWQDTTPTRLRHPWTRWDSNLHSQQANGRRPTP
jgi:hypothetical protein